MLKVIGKLFLFCIGGFTFWRKVFKLGKLKFEVFMFWVCINHIGYGFFYSSVECKSESVFQSGRCEYESRVAGDRLIGEEGRIVCVVLNNVCFGALFLVHSVLRVVGKIFVMLSSVVDPSRSMLGRLRGHRVWWSEPVDSQFDVC